MSDLLPILDLSTYPILQLPGEPFIVLDPPSDAQEPSGAEDAPLHQLLGIPALLEQLATARPLAFGSPYVREFKQLLVPVGKTSEGALVAVALHLVGRGKHYAYQWIGCICQPEHYEALQKALEAKTESIRKDLRKDLESNRHQ